MDFRGAVGSLFRNIGGHPILIIKNGLLDRVPIFVQNDAMRFKPVATWLLVLTFLALIAMAALADPIPENFFRAMNQVETAGKTGTIWGKHGDLGPLQITKAYWLSSGVKGNFMQCTNLTYSKLVVTAYMKKYAKQALQLGDWETIARIHNGGPNGHRKKVTLAYWRKIREKMSRQ